jgi:hypothetical protein
MKKFFSGFEFKFVDLPLPIGGLLDLSIDSPYENMKLELGSTYYFIVYYMDKPLTKKGVPYSPVKLTILDIKGSSDNKDSIHASEESSIDLDYLLGYLVKGNNTLTSKVILSIVISDMVYNSDLIRDILDNDYKNCLNPEGVSINRNYVLNLSLAYYKCG